MQSGRKPEEPKDAFVTGEPEVFGSSDDVLKHATFWIRRSITCGIVDNGRTIRVPVHMNETIRQMMNTTNMMAQEIGHEPSAKEVAEGLHLIEGKVNEAYRIHHLPVSLDTPVGGDEDTSCGDFIDDKNAQSPEDVVIASVVNKELY